MGLLRELSDEGVVDESALEMKKQISAENTVVESPPSDHEDIDEDIEDRQVSEV